MQITISFQLNRFIRDIYNTYIFTLCNYYHFFYQWTVQTNIVGCLLFNIQYFLDIKTADIIIPRLIALKIIHSAFKCSPLRTHSL